MQFSLCIIVHSRGGCNELEAVKDTQRAFPGGSVVKTQHVYCSSIVSVPSWGTEIPHADWPKKKKKSTQHPEMNM